MSDVGNYLLEASRALTHAKVLLEHSYGITSFDSFRQLSEESQCFYMSAIRERVSAAEEAVERAQNAASEEEDDVSPRRGKRVDWGES